MAINEFLPHATGVGANVLDQSAWLASPARQTGFVAGVANPQEANKSLRQGTAAAAAIMQWASSRSGYDALDDGDIDVLSAVVARADRAQADNYISSVGGTANAITLTPALAIGTPTDGLVFRFMPLASNAGAVTINGDPVVYADGTSMIAGEFDVTRPAYVLHSAGKWFLLSPYLYWSRRSPAGAMVASAFTAGQVHADISSPNTEFVSQSVSITGAAYIDATGSIAHQNMSSSLCNTTVFLRLLGVSDAPYIGQISANSFQITLSVSGLWTGLSRSNTYTLQLISQKQQNVGPVKAQDARILARYG